MITWNLEMWSDALDRNVPSYEIPSLIEKETCFAEELSLYSFYADCPRISLCSQEQEIYGIEPAFPLYLILGLTTLWSEFLESRIFLEEGEGGSCWIIRSTPENVAIKTGEFSIYDRNKLSGEDWQDLFIVPQPAEIIASWNSLNDLLNMDLWSWVSGILRISGQFSSIIQIGLPEIREALGKGAIVRELEGIVAAYEREAPLMESWLLENQGKYQESIFVAVSSQ